VIERIRVGHLNIVRLSPKSTAVEPAVDAKPYLSALEVLERVLAPGPWALAGGLVVPIAVGTFYRRHGDIDIVLPLTGLPVLMESFRRSGYELYTSWTVSHHSRGLLMECRIKGDGAMVSFRPRRLYVKPGNPRAAPQLLRKIDLYPYRIRGDRLETCNTGQVLPRSTMQNGSLKSFGHPGHVRCLHLDNVASLKSRRSGAKHRLDCAVIKAGPDVALEWFGDRPASAAPAPAVP